MDDHVFPPTPILSNAPGGALRRLGPGLAWGGAVDRYRTRSAVWTSYPLLPGLASALKVSVDDLVGYTEVKEVQAPRSTRLWRKFRDVEKLSEADRRAVLRFVDALLAKQRLEHQRG
jgi:hypothetical protein